MIMCSVVMVMSIDTYHGILFQLSPDCEKYTGFHAIQYSIEICGKDEVCYHSITGIITIRCRSSARLVNCSSTSPNC